MTRRRNNHSYVEHGHGFWHHPRHQRRIPGKSSNAPKRWALAMPGSTIRKCSTPTPLWRWRRPAMQTSRIHLGTRRARALQPPGAGDRQLSGVTQPPGAGPHSFRHRHRLYGAARHGSWRRQARRHGQVYSAGAGPAQGAKPSRPTLTARGVKFAFSTRNSTSSIRKTTFRSTSRPSARAARPSRPNSAPAGIYSLRHPAQSVEQLQQMQQIWQQAGRAPRRPLRHRPSERLRPGARRGVRQP